MSTKKAEELASDLKRKLQDLGAGDEVLGLIEQLEKRVRTGAAKVFNIPPSEVDEKSFELKYGLVEVHHDQMPDYDRFRGAREMTDEALGAVHCCFGISCFNASKAYDDPVEEDKSGGVHTVMLLGFRPFTKPKPETEQAVSTRTRAATGNRSSKVQAKDAASKGKFEMRLQQAKVEDVDDTASVSSGGSNKIIRIEDQSGSHWKKREKADHKIFVFNAKYSTLKNPHGKTLTIVADRKTLVKLVALLQAACYGLESLEQWTLDLEKKYRPPVGLEVWDASRWYYGFLEVDDFVEVVDGNITEASLKRFPEEVEEAIGKKFTRSFTQAEVLAMFAGWKSKLKDDAGSIPNRHHPVGRLYLRTKHYPMPRYVKDDAHLSSGAKRFYEGNLKLLRGGEVRGWSDSDVMKAWLSRQEEERQMHDQAASNLVRPWIKKILYPDFDVDALCSAAD